MATLPFFVELNDAPVLLVGSGVAALRKLERLVAAGARMTVIAESTAPAPPRWREAPSVRWLPRRFHPDAADRPFRLVVTAADAQVNRRVARWARQRGIWVNAVDDPANSSALWPAVVDRRPVQIAIGTGGAAPVLARRIREVIERLLPARLGPVAELAHRLRRQVAERIPPSGRRRFWEALFQRIPDDPREFAASARRALDESPATRVGKVDLVGAGPGDPDLLTVRAARVLQIADVIVYDRLVDPRILGRARRDAEFIAVGKTPGGPCTAQSEINELLVSRARRGDHVCRLKGGDPTIFARAGEEIERLTRAEIPFEIVPGITAALGSAAAAGISLTHRREAHAVVLATAHGSDAGALRELADLAGNRRTLAVYMGVGRLGELRATLLEHGLPQTLPVCIVENAARPDERRVLTCVGDLGETASRIRLRSPALIIIGRVAAHARVSVGTDPVTKREALVAI